MKYNAIHITNRSGGAGKLFSESFHTMITFFCKIAARIYLTLHELLFVRKGLAYSEEAGFCNDLSNHNIKSDSSSSKKLDNNDRASIFRII